MPEELPPMMTPAAGSGTPFARGYAAAQPPRSRAERDALVRRGLPLVRRLAFRMARRLPASVEVGDLIGAGSEGLMKAAASYDASKHPRFEPYAAARIRGAMLDELRSADPVTRHGRQKMAEVSKAIARLTQQLGRPPEEAEIAEALGVTLERYRKLAEDLAKAPALGHVGDVLPDDLQGASTDPSQAYLEREQQRLVAEAITRLPERTQMVLALYYQEECTQAEIGRILEVSEGRVCQILGEAAARIRAELGLERKRPKRRRRAPKAEHAKNAPERADANARRRS